MDNGLIPQRYAKALYKYGLEHGITEQLYNVMKVVVSSFESNPDLQKVLSNPFVNDEDKEKLLLSAAGKEAGDAYARFVKLILAHGRADYAYLMMIAYRDLYRRENHISQVKIATAAPMPESMMEKLHSLVSKSFSESVLEFSHSIDPDLIGGFVIDVDSVRMDASISNELEQLRLTLLRSNN
ncbi:MAG: F0F1 ATP synthase subunit delta [Muribaculaceae bacterium]|nr:F0F1 ATP synthase subunit delta [Muribaculaceae bacterium]MDE6755344.1 F0F1 ATP synthase subunit delta [Muribaculaceae bacterium]